MSQVDRNNIREIYDISCPKQLRGSGAWREPDRRFQVTIIKESASDLIKELRDKGVPIQVQEVTRADWVNFVLTSAPLFLLVGFWIVMMRQMKLRERTNEILKQNLAQPDKS